jgi:hypothetical protein
VAKLAGSLAVAVTVKVALIGQCDNVTKFQDICGMEPDGFGSTRLDSLDDGCDQSCESDQVMFLRPRRIARTLRLPAPTDCQSALFHAANQVAHV